MKEQVAEKVFKSRGKHRHISLALLEVAPDAQRDLRLDRVRKIVSKFNIDLFGEIIVSHRAGHYYVVDGQHRVSALREMGWTDQQIPCLMYEDMTLAEEARLFIGIIDRRGPKTVDTFRVAVVGQDPKCVSIDRVVRSQGLVISDRQRDGCVAAVMALRRIHDGGGITDENPGALVRTLAVLKRAWGDGPESFVGPLIVGVGLLLLRYNSEVDENALVDKLSHYSGGPTGVVRNGKSNMVTKRRPQGVCTAAAIVDIYNQGKRTNKLKDWWA